MRVHPSALHATDHDKRLLIIFSETEQNETFILFRKAHIWVNAATYGKKDHILDMSTITLIRVYRN